MPEELNIFQCEDCLRYFVLGDGVDGARLVERPLGVLPESGRCGLGDCAGIRQARLVEERSRASAEVRPAMEFRRRCHERWLERRQGASPRDGRRVVKALGGAAAVLKGEAAGVGRSACPPERELPVHYGSSQREFHAAVDVSPAVRVLLEYLNARFGEWVPMVVLEQLEGCHMVHSRVADARRELHDDQDVDQKSLMHAPTGLLHSHYRLCWKADSERLKRKSKRDEAQGELSAMEGQQ